MRIVVLGSVFFILFHCSSVCQEGPSQSALRELRPLAEQLQEAFDKRDFHLVCDRIESLYNSMQTLRPSLDTPENLLNELEASLSKTPLTRDSAVFRIAFRAEQAGQYDKARRYAIEAQEYARRQGKYRVQNGYYANQVLGLLALREGDTAAAGRFLLASVDEGGWPLLATVGPNLLLAQRLTIAKEVDPVIRYLERCKDLWPSGESKVIGWLAALRAGKIPDFSPHQLIHP